MKKIASIIMAAAITVSNASFVLAGDIDFDSDVVIAEETVIAAESEEKNVELMAAVEGIRFEYDPASSTDLERVVKVKYDRSYFTSGINSFNVAVNIPNQYVSDVTYSTRISGADITGKYVGNIFICTMPELNSNKIPSDGALFTMRITLKDYILQPFTINITGDTYLSDKSGTVQRLSNGGLTETELDIPANTSDEGDSGVDGAVTWEYTNEVLKIHGKGIMNSYEQGTAPWYKHRDKIKSIVFTADDLSNIGRNAFYGLSNAEIVVLSSDIRSINDNAFEGCTSLTTIDIPTNANLGIGDYAFKGCSSLTTVDIPSSVASIGRGAFEGCAKLHTVVLPFVGSQKGDANTSNTFPYIFNDNVPALLKTVSITNDTAIPSSAFEGCSNIESISINEGVTRIGASAFKGCSNLFGFKIPSTVSEIADYTFQNCSGMTSVVVPSSIQAIGTQAFDGCRKLASVYIPSGVAEIEDFTFRNCAALTAIEIPTTVEQIGMGVLTGCNKLIDISVPFVGANGNPGSTSVTDEGIFGYLFGATDNGNVPASVTKVEITSTSRTGYIPKEAFRNCGNIEDIIVHGGRAVLDNAFRNCKNLKTLILPKSISTMGDTILADCTKLRTLEIPFIGKSRSDKNTETSVIGGFFGYNDQDITGIMQYYDGVNYHYYKVPTTLTNVTVINHTDIPAGAFSECSFIKEVNIASGASMGTKAFYHCDSLEIITLPKDLQNIGEEAFAECENLKTIHLPAKVRTIGSNAFYNDRSIEDVWMPDSITTIADDVFNGTDLFGGEVDLMSAGGTITCSLNSAAYQYAQEKGIATNVVDSDELNVIEVGATIEKLSTDEYIINVSDTNNLSGTVYAAIYDNSGKLLAVRSEKTSTDTAQGGSSYHMTFGAAESQGIKSAKVFVWNNKLQSLTTNVKTITEIPTT